MKIRKNNNNLKKKQECVRVIQKAQENKYFIITGLNKIQNQTKWSIMKEKKDYIKA